ncbi:MAG: hypothetical protein JNM31_14310 [Flavobacteriales bacterium]|nr:hypothetical protein [Flavobacteriales bacterium]
MHILLPIAFCIGLVLKLLHLPYHTVVLLIVLGVALGWCIVQLVRGKEQATAWAALAVWTWGAHLVALLKLFPFRSATLVLAAAITLAAIIMLVRRRPLATRPMQVLGGVFILAMLIMAVPTADRYHFTNLRFSLERDTDFISWDKYSFFLLREGRINEALAANDAAEEAAMKDQDEAAAELLRGRRGAIEQDAWERYTPLLHGH